MNRVIGDFTEYADFVGNQESQYITSFEDHKDAIWDRLQGVNYGDHLCWSKTSNLVSLRAKEVSIWGGSNGSGKSLMLGQIASFLALDSKVLIASLEMPIEATAARMLRQVTGQPNPSRKTLDAFARKLSGNLWVYDQLDSVETIRIYGLIHYAAKELGVRHIFIDSLAKCGVAEDDYNGQKEIVDKFGWMAKTLDIHIHLVHHIRKGEKEGKKPDKFDIRGSSTITDLVDNVFLVWRNKSKEERVRDGEEVDEPDASLIVAKQRHGEWEGEFLFWFDKKSMQYCPDSRAIPLPWPDPETHYATFS